MRVVSFRGREDKLALAGDILSDYLRGSVLDVGCDRRWLSSRVIRCYIGVDISGTPDLVVNVEHGLPFRDRSFDTVVAFDILEHLDNVHYAFDELCRVARRHVIIGLPNMYEWRFRLMFLLGRKLGGNMACRLSRLRIDIVGYFRSTKLAPSFNSGRLVRGSTCAKRCSDIIATEGFYPAS